MSSRAPVLVALVGTALLAAACAPSEPPRRYDLTGQILAVHADRSEVTIRHEDIVGFMPGMTMTFPVDPPALLDGRAPGELVEGVLEVDRNVGRLVEIRHVGDAPLPENANQLAMASGLLEVGDQVPDAAFVDQADRRRALAEWRGTATVLTFIYTNCPLPNFCPLMDQNFATLQDAIGEDPALRGRVKLISVSFDPARDTPEVLAAHADRQHADPEVWTLLTGDQATVDRFAGRFGVGVLRMEDSGEIAHNLRTAVIGPDGRILKLYSGGDWTPNLVLADLRAALQP